MPDSAADRLSRLRPGEHLTDSAFLPPAERDHDSIERALKRLTGKWGNPIARVKRRTCGEYEVTTSKTWTAGSGAYVVIFVTRTS